MDRPSIMHRFSVQVSDIDRAVYDEFEIRIAQHPSETVLYLVTRVMAYALHLGDDVELSKAGLCDPTDPPLYARDLTGRMTHWIDIGQPSADRLHKAGKQADSVYVYTYKNPQLLVDAVAKSNVYGGDQIQPYALDPNFVSALAETVTRNNAWTLVRTEGELFITIGDENLNGRLTPWPLG